MPVIVYAHEKGINAVSYTHLDVYKRQVDKMNEMLRNNDQMSHRIFETQKRLYESELVKNESEIYALRSQINPHFLYNTLQCMGGIALMNDQPVVAEMAANMAEIFRYSIKEGDKVSMEEEADFLRKYLDICDVRFNGRFKWRIELEEGLELSLIHICFYSGRNLPLL